MEQTETSTEQRSWLQDAFKNGIILGVTHIIIFLILYYILPSKLTGFSYVFAILAINLTFSIYQGQQWRKEIGGFMGFGPAFKYIFVLLAINGLLGMIFNAIFLFVEPSYPDLLASSQLDTSIYWAEKFGAPEASLDQMRDSFNAEDIANRYRFPGVLMGFGFGILFYALGGLIGALFVRKNPPEIM